MEGFLLFLGFVIPQIVFTYALLWGVASVLKREEAVETEQKRVQRLEALLEGGVEVQGVRGEGC